VSSPLPVTVDELSNVEDIYIFLVDEYFGGLIGHFYFYSI
jgi:hypothetical protein